MLKQRGPGVFSPAELVTALSADSKNVNSEAAINELLHRGVIVGDPKGYAIPIPSMREWLMTLYG